MNAEEETENWAPQHWSRQEWFYMWTKGLDPRRIAKICRVPYRKVYDHIRTRVNHNPALFGQRLMFHDHPQVPRWGLENRKLTWQERAAELAAFRRTHGRFPRSYVEGEKKLYSFLQYQRERYRGGKLPSAQKSYLDKHLVGWLTLPKARREVLKWEQRATELGNFVSERGRFPGYRMGDTFERKLATWLRWQRQRLRNQTLDPARRKRLNELIPNWHGQHPEEIDAGKPY